MKKVWCNDASPFCFLLLRPLCAVFLIAILMADSAWSREGKPNVIIIIMQSDHGHSMEERAHFGGGSAGPYRGAKFSIFEGGIRVPAIISWPGHLEAGGVRDQIAHGSDWFPTIAALCGVPLPITPIDGKSLVPVLRSAEALQHPTRCYWATRGGKGYQWAVREGDWKLIGNPLDPSAPKGTVLPKYMLVNLALDPGERTNLVEREPVRFAALKELHETWFSQLP